MKALLESEFGLKTVEITQLNGYENINYLVKSGGEKFIFKTYEFSSEMLDFITAENEILLHINSPETTYYPKPIPFADGSFAKTVDLKGKETICRMLSFIEGDFFGDTEPTEGLMSSFGTFVANLDLKLKGVNSYVIQARRWEWDLQYFDLNKKLIDAIPSAKDRNTVRYFFQQFEENVTPVLSELRKQVIHNDPNEWNTLVKNGGIAGIIDFGDLAYSPLINEIGIALAYACFDKEDPLKTASEFLSAYHKIVPLQEIEMKVLYYLIPARLVTSVCNSAQSQITNPENEYISVSANQAWSLLYKWLQTNPIAAENTFREAINLDPIQPPSIDSLIAKRHEHVSSILSMSYKDPIHMDRSAFQYMYDTAGNTFLDAYNNIPHVGHSHPKVVNAGQRQMAKLNTNTRYLYDELATYAEKLIAKFPKELTTVYFVNSGSAASDLAIRIAFTHTKQKALMVMEHGYHGHTQVATDISDYKFNNPKGQGQKENIIKTSIPDTYRGKYKASDVDAGKKYAIDAIQQIDQATTPIAAFISEPIVGCGGQVPLADGYLSEIYPAIRKQGGVCISDEVQTGFGRLGDHFWGFEAHDVVPDIVIIGKPMGNGHPLGAAIVTDEIAESFGEGVEFFSSFGGNPVSCAIGSAVLDVIEEEGLQQNAKEVGDYYKSLFNDLKNEFSCIGDVRGSGLFLGVEIVKDSSDEPDTALAQKIKNKLRDEFILISTDGPHDNVIKTKPPLCFTKENAEDVVRAIKKVLRQAQEPFLIEDN